MIPPKRGTEGAFNSNAARFIAIALGWAACVLGLHVYSSIKLVPAGFGPSVFVEQLVLELALGPNFVSFWLQHLFGVGICSLFFLAAWAIGRSLLPWFGKADESIPSSLILPLSLGLGLGALGYLAFGLAALGLAKRSIIIGCYCVISTIGIRTAIVSFRDRASSSVGVFNGPSAIEKAVGGLLFLLLSLAFLGSTIPEIFYDALTYHLAVPQTYLFAGRMIDMPYNHYSYLPLFTSMLYFWGLALGGMYLAKLMSFAIGCCIVIGLYQWGKVLSNRATGLLACAIFLGTPLVMYLFWTCGSDLSTAFFILLALMATWCWLQDQKRSRLLYLAGIFSGLSLASKYTAAVGILILTLFAAWTCWKERAAGGLRIFSIYCCLAIIPLTPWWIRNYVFRANPFYPYLAQTVGPKDADIDLLRGWYSETRSGSPGVRPLRHLEKLWIDAVSGKLPTVDYLGPIFLGCILLIVNVWKVPWVRLGFIFCCASLLFGLSATYIARLLIPYYVPLALILAFAAISLRPAQQRWALPLVMCGLAFNTYRMFMITLLTPLKGLSVATGRAAPSEYLRKPRTLYPNPSYNAYEFIGKLQLSPQERILAIGESRIFYSPNLTIGNAPHDVPIIFNWANASTDSEELHAKLKAQNITIIFSNKPEAARNDAKKYVTEQGITKISLMLDRHFDKIYEDSWTVAYRKKG